MVDHGPRVGSESTHGAPDVPINLHDLLDGIRLEQGRLGALLDGEDDALGSLDPDRGRPEFDRLDRVLYLEQSTFGGERVDLGTGWLRVVVASQSLHRDHLAATGAGRAESHSHLDHIQSDWRAQVTERERDGHGEMR